MQALTPHRFYHDYSTNVYMYISLSSAILPRTIPNGPVSTPDGSINQITRILLSAF